MKITILSSILLSFTLLALSTTRQARARQFERSLLREQGLKRFSWERRQLYRDHDSRERGHDGRHGGHHHDHDGHHGHGHHHPHSDKSSKSSSKSKSNSKKYATKSQSQSKSHSEKMAGPSDTEVQPQFGNINAQARVVQEAEEQK